MVKMPIEQMNPQEPKNEIQEKGERNQKQIYRRSLSCIHSGRSKYFRNIINFRKCK
jgi:hypothetical protein